MSASHLFRSSLYAIPTRRNSAANIGIIPQRGKMPGLAYIKDGAEALNVEKYRL
jgi:hypothetical protein